MDLGLLYSAIEQGQVTMIAANATDGLLSKMDLTVLRDDQHAFPPYHVGIVAGRTPCARRRVYGRRFSNYQGNSLTGKCRISISRWMASTVPSRRSLQSS